MTVAQGLEPGARTRLRALSGHPISRFLLVRTGTGLLTLFALSVLVFLCVLGAAR